MISRKMYSIVKKHQNDLMSAGMIGLVHGVMYAGWGSKEKKIVHDICVRAQLVFSEDFVTDITQYDYILLSLLLELNELILAMMPSKRYELVMVMLIFRRLCTIVTCNENEKSLIQNTGYESHDLNDQLERILVLLNGELPVGDSTRRNRGTYIIEELFEFKTMIHAEIRGRNRFVLGS